ncbi:hypothetical protein SDC9_86471 [bioreactor metagenome]|uniref:Uncharacterized protein n=1 Tax=bioreactor metagenome TaxID=1076179 RepID=A0A644ZG18_9ZZZZ
MGAFLDDQFGKGFGGKPGNQQAGRGVNQGGMHADSKPEAVEQGKNGEHFPTGENAVAHRRGLHGQGVEIQVGQEDALGLSRCAAAV